MTPLDKRMLKAIGFSIEPDSSKKGFFRLIKPAFISEEQSLILYHGERRAWEINFLFAQEKMPPSFISEEKQKEVMQNLGFSVLSILNHPVNGKVYYYKFEEAGASPSSPQTSYLTEMEAYNAAYKCALISMPDRLEKEFNEVFGSKSLLEFLKKQNDSKYGYIKTEQLSQAEILDPDIISVLKSIGYEVLPDPDQPGLFYFNKPNKEGSDVSYWTETEAWSAIYEQAKRDYPDKLVIPEPSISHTESPSR